MAYVDTIHPNQRLGMLGVVAVIHLAAGYVLVTGLVATGVVRTEPRILATFTPQTPTPPRRPRPSPEPTHTRLHDPIPIPTLSFPPIDPIFTFAPPSTSGDAVGEASFPGVGSSYPPTAKPSFAPKGPKPLGETGRWVTPADYPSTDLRLGHAGVTGVRLTIGADGRITDCTVRKSSGWANLDDTACRLLSRRGRFSPAIDTSGAQTPGAYDTAVRWEVPD